MSNPISSVDLDGLLEYSVYRLFMTFRLDQHVVADRFYSDCDCEQGSEGGLAGSVSIEAEDEFVGVGL